MAKLGKATPILTANEVIDALDMDDDFSESDALELSQRASDWIYHLTGYDFAKDGTDMVSEAKQVARMKVYQLYYMDSDDNRNKYLNLGLASLQDKARTLMEDEQ